MTYKFTSDKTGREFIFDSEEAYEAAREWYMSADKGDMIEFCLSRCADILEPNGFHIRDAEGYFWSNGAGWVPTKSQATVFNECRDSALPDGGRWEKIRGYKLVHDWAPIAMHLYAEEHAN